MPYIGRSPSIGVRSRYIYTASGGQTLFSGTDSNGKTLAYDDGAYVDVYLNGVNLVPTTDFTATTKTSITLTSGAAASDIVEIVAYDIASIADTVSKANGGTFDGDVSFPDDIKAIFGNGSDLQIYHDGSHSYVQDAGSGNLYLRQNGTAVIIDDGTNNLAAFNSVSGESALYYGGSGKKLATTSTGIDVTGTAVTDGVTVAGNLSVDGGTIKLDGDYPTGTGNVALGDTALDDGSYTGNYTTAIGSGSFSAATSGGGNVGVGFSTGRVTTTGSNNVFIGAPDVDGYTSGWGNTTGSTNIAVGSGSLGKNTTGYGGTAVGHQAGRNNQTGTSNTFIGEKAGYNTTSSNNTFVGGSSGYNVSTGGYNTFVGWPAGLSMTTGGSNVIIGGFNGNSGGVDLRTSSNNIVLSGDGNANVHFRVGSGTWLRSVIGTGAGTNTVKYNTSTSELTYDTSSARYKENIRDSVYGLSDVLQMQSRMFEYKKEGTTDIGLVAEELNPIIPELVGKDADGQPDSVSYDRMVSVLVKAIQELSAKNDALESRITELETN